MSSSDKKMGKDEITRILDGNVMDEMIPAGNGKKSSEEKDLAGLERAVAQDGDAATDADVNALLSAEAGKGPAEVGDLDAILAGAGGTDPNDAMGQNDIDALLAAALPGDAGGNAPAAAATPADAGGSTNVDQSEIDALLASTGGNDAPAPADAGGSTTVGQDDIDALLAAAGDGASEPAAPAAGDDTNVGQDEIDALLANAAGDAAATTPAPAATGDATTVGQDDIDALLASAGAGDAAPAAPADDAASMGQDDIDAILNAAKEDAAPAPEPTTTANASDDAPASNEEIDALFAANAAATAASAPAAPSPAAPTRGPEPADAAPTPPPPPARPTPLPAAPEVPGLTPEQEEALKNSLALSGSSGEVENLAGQISGLLGQLSEKSRRFQMAWMAAEQQARELRYQLTLAEHKMQVLAGEKESVRQEAELLRKRQSQTEGEKIAASEAHRTEVASLQLRIREQESRNQMLASEGSALKEELERARNDATGADLESRRARFDAERLSGELAAERQERQRLARALENREKELQATQAQAAGHASTLFLDELHRLVRRLESELDIRGTAANEALSVFDRMEFAPEMQMHAATLRAALCTAAGLTPDENDALKKLDRQGETPSAVPPLNPAPAPGEDSFAKALTRYDFTRASAICSAMMRAGSLTPCDCMREAHRLDALRHPEIAAHLDDLAALLRGIKSLQEASDRSRGRENAATEKTFVMMFDLLHSLVRLKLVSRATPAIWELFLELRGRFSFLTSDRQWKEYRDRVLAASA